MHVYKLLVWTRRRNSQGVYYPTPFTLRSETEGLHMPERRDQMVLDLCQAYSGGK